ncbi:hypothetical protein PIB30_058276 [Stylosanthes scabra]|uniref:Transposase MuDR plant domain-containing protein n=1 Tax=Stylosanthes scabra TaxID=79078 RepID=A0ABU6VI51_9FABA|nr:hypothetical protein [Stylosanthes scabra]
MSEPPLLYIHYDGEITADHNGSVVFCSNQPVFIQMPRDVRSLAALKNFVAQAIGVQDTKRVTKIYYRYPVKADGNFQFKRYRLRDDDDVKLIRGWHKHFSTILLLELFVCLVDRCEGGSANAGGPDDDPTTEFEVGQQFENKEEVLMAVKTYSIRRAVQFKIIESDQLKYVVRCAEFGKGCE